MSFLETHQIKMTLNEPVFQESVQLVDPAKLTDSGTFPNTYKDLYHTDPNPSQPLYYVYDTILGNTPTSSIYLGYDPKFEREVAIKVMNMSPWVERKKINDLLEREAKELASVDDARYIGCFDLIYQRDAMYMVMEYMNPTTYITLTDWINKTTSGEIEMNAKYGQCITRTCRGR